MTGSGVSKNRLTKEQLTALQNIIDCIDDEGVDGYLAFIQVMEESELISGRVDEETLNNIFVWAEQHARNILKPRPSIHSHYHIAALIEALFRLGNDSIIESYTSEVHTKMQEKYA